MSANFSLSRAEFKQACNTLISQQVHENKAGGTHWRWNEHALYPLGYMSRQRQVSLLDRPYLDDETLEENLEAEESGADDAVLATGPAKPNVTLVTIDEHVVFSSTFQVPTLYFNIYGPNGSPLPLEGVIKSGFIHRHTLPPLETTSFSLTSVDSSFPLLSHGDHPTLGTPFWYLHPCETSVAVGEIMTELEREGRSEGDRLYRWMQAWFMVLAGVVDLSQ